MAFHLTLKAWRNKSHLVHWKFRHVKSCSFINEGFSPSQAVNHSRIRAPGWKQKGEWGKKGETFSVSHECKLCNITRSVKVSKMCPGWLVPQILPSINQGNSDSLVAQDMMFTYRLLEKTDTLQPLKICVLQEIGFFLSHSQEDAETILFIPHSGVTEIRIEAKGPHIIWQVPVNIMWTTIMFLFFQIQ